MGEGMTRGADPDGLPLSWDGEHRADLGARAYGATRDELRYIRSTPRM